MAVADEIAGKPPPLLEPGSVFHGAYDVVRCIKSGGMGAVYEVVQRSTQRRRALKVMLPGIVGDPDMRARFKLEATVAAGIESEHIVETVDAGVDEATGVPFLVMELLKGEELRHLLESRGRLSPEDTLAVVYQVGLALDRTHAAGVIHRDLKPANLFLVRRDDGSPRVKVLDFGVAKIVEQSTVSSDATRSVGSPLYMSPEQIRGDKGIGPRADLYALGHLAFTMLTGQAYWAEERRASAGIYPFLMTVMGGQNELAATRAARLGVTLPPDFNVWFAKATAFDPELRFGSAAALTAALAEALLLQTPASDAASSLRMPLEPAPQSERRPIVKAAASADSTEAPTTVKSLPRPIEPLSTIEGAPRKRFPWLPASLGVAAFVAIVGYAAIEGPGASRTPPQPADRPVPPPATASTPTAETLAAEAPSPSASSPAPEASASAAPAASALPSAWGKLRPPGKPAEKPGGTKSDPLNDY